LATSGRIRGLGRPLLSPASPASGWRSSKSRDYFLSASCPSSYAFICLRSFSHVQSSPDNVREWQERLVLGGIWEKGQVDTGGGFVGGLNS
jgi:hypothetical protein